MVGACGQGLGLCLAGLCSGPWAHGASTGVRLVPSRAQGVIGLPSPVGIAL